MNTNKEIVGKKITAFVPDVDWLGDYGLEEVINQLGGDFESGMLLFEDGTAVYCNEIETLKPQDIKRILKEYQDFVSGYSEKLQQIVSLASTVETIAKVTKVSPVAKKASRPVAKKAAKRPAF